uniref:Uncharacterized protein, isoform A n=2 Tax=Drosophila melanogaster TaxID=7227 RepID=Q9VAK2_DROME|nr:uncharacterized protein Dmel_CG11470, isoform B [Drosophila melanogaster]NP_651700.2 uncharacterized protein Dmel_CG11470, isoform A [Drosophila melanogaster]AAF56904.1 uncharacterized protein Dmel_CG11470, isoform A [Drosophila melanogaster]AHN57584.1 uncharacterized protein Dmel_CG11470, isoform B [Drosophila melanogaster]AOQ11304.1 CG11470-RA [synthetic construct]|eukprot:NP_001287585.1 uncharacterized protein Dmel_CG11470, isoform B [Drosophila melanogaster]
MFAKQAKILVFCLSLGLSLAVKLQIPFRPDAHIQELQLQSRELAEVHSDHSTQCFSIYKPKLAKIADQFETNFTACISAYDNCTSHISEKYAEDRQILLRSANIGCSYPNSNCQVWTLEQQPLDTVVSRLECASTNSAESSKTFYAISANATQIAVQIQEQYTILESRKSVCINDANRSYVEDTSDTYELLNNCLKNGPTTTTCNPLTYPTTTTATTTTTTITTAAPLLR